MTTETKEPARFREIVTALVRRDARDLTLRQLAILMTTKNCATVRGLAVEFHIQKPAVTRAVSRLLDLGLVTRTRDPADGRSVLIRSTETGAEFIAGLGAARGQEVA